MKTALLKIEIQNVRGIKNRKFEWSIQEGLNILMCENGFGKSSIAEAFKLINLSNRNREIQKYNENGSLCRDEQFIAIQQNKNNDIRKNSGIKDYYNVIIIDKRCEIKKKDMTRSKLHIEDIILTKIKRVRANYDKLNDMSICEIEDYLLKNKNSTKEKSIRERLEYLKFKDNIEKELAFIQEYYWCKVQVIEKENSLVAIFPEGGKLSSGEQDLLIIITSLLRDFDKEKDNLVIVDGVTDCLDNSNFMALNLFIKRYKGQRVYFIIMSHICEIYYKGMNYGNIHYLDGGINTRSFFDKFKVCVGIIAERYSINKDKKEGSKFDDDISTYLLHFKPIKKSNICESYSGSNFEFYKDCLIELNKFVIDKSIKSNETKLSLDPLKIIIGIRHVVEYSLFEKCESDEIKEELLNTRGTSNRIEFYKNSQESFETLSIYEIVIDFFNLFLHKNIKEKKHLIPSLVSRLENRFFKVFIRNILREGSLGENYEKYINDSLNEK